MKQVLAFGTDGEASGPSEFKEAYASAKSRKHLLWEHEVASSSLAAPTIGPFVVRFEFARCTCFGVAWARLGPRWSEASAALASIFH